MKERLFRKKSIERISSPEQLDNYIRVANPSVWMILSCVIIFLIGICVWGIFGRLNTKVTAPVICNGTKTVCYVREENLSEIEAGMTLVIEETEYTITSVNSKPMKVTDEFGEYAMQIGGFQMDEWIIELVVNAALKEGIYRAEIVTESIAPVSFLLN